MPLSPAREHEIFEELSRSLSKLPSKPTPKNVHQFRTNSRRVQALLDELVPELTRNDKKLHKLLSRLRKRPGRIRDLDTQISVLRTLKLSDKTGSRAQLLRTLCNLRARRAKKLAKVFDADTIREVRRRIKRTAATLQIPQNSEPLQLALRLFTAEDSSPLTEERLHQYRLLGKRARYLAEFATSTPESQSVITQLKRMQDALGEWHDWLTLTHSAEERLDGLHRSDMIVALRNLTRVRFRRAVEVVMQTRKALLDKPALAEVPRRAPSAAREAARAAIA